MKLPPLLLLALCCSTLVAQTPPTPILHLRIVPEKETYVVHETVFVRGELTNASNRTLCFPVPVQDCFFGPTGSLLTTGEPLNGEESRYFMCRKDGAGPYGDALDDAVKNKWVWLHPGQTYAAKPAKAILHLDEAGRWKLRAEYTSPEGSFSQEYKRILKEAAQRAGCTLPDGTVSSEPSFITVEDINPNAKATKEKR